MHFAGSTEINAPRDRVWAFVVDPEQVGWCGPGVESIEVIDGSHFRARAKVGVGVVSARFNVDLELADAVPPDRAVIKAAGRAPGSSVEATGSMSLSGPPDGPTTMDWEANVTILGTFAAVAARLVEGQANRMIKQAFDCMRAKLEA